MWKEGSFISPLIFLLTELEFIKLHSKTDHPKSEGPHYGVLHHKPAYQREPQKTCVPEKWEQMEEAILGLTLMILNMCMDDQHWQVPHHRESILIGRVKPSALTIGYGIWSFPVIMITGRSYCVSRSSLHAPQRGKAGLQR